MKTSGIREAPACLAGGAGGVVLAAQRRAQHLSGVGAKAGVGGRGASRLCPGEGVGAPSHCLVAGAPAAGTPSGPVHLVRPAGSRQPALRRAAGGTVAPCPLPE